MACNGHKARLEEKNTQFSLQRKINLYLLKLLAYKIYCTITKQCQHKTQSVLLFMYKEILTQSAVTYKVSLPWFSIYSLSCFFFPRLINCLFFISMFFLFIFHNSLYNMSEMKSLYFGVFVNSYTV